MKGFSIVKGRWWALLVAGTLILLILPMLAGAQTEGEEPSEGAAPIAEEGSEGTGVEEGAVPADVVEDILDAAGMATTEPVESLPPPPKPEDLIDPGTFYIQDRINDMGGTIALKWQATPSDEIKTTYTPEPIEGISFEPEEVTKFSYYILHSLDPDAPIDEWEIVNIEPYPADTNYTYEQQGYFGFFLQEPRNSGNKEHYFFYTHMIPNFTKKKAIYKVTISQAQVEAAAGGEPEYRLNTFIVDAWLYHDDLKTPEYPWQENKGDDFKVTANLSPLTGEKDTIVNLEFVEFADKGLGMHYQGELTTAAEPDRGKGLIRLKAVGKDLTLAGKVKFKKAPGLPVNVINEEERLPDNRYTHYFKLGIDYFDRQGLPRWVVEHDPPLGIAARANLVNTAKWNSFLYMILLSIAILFFIFRARKGKDLFIRRIAGLDHVEEAIGRATEMGKPILYVPGMGYMSDVATIAATNILGQVTKKVAEYDSQVIVPCRDPIVMTVCQEISQEAYLDAGHPDAYNKDNIYFLTDDQFSYVAAVDGIMVRDKPATNFFMGMFYAESLLLAETGAGTGAIQIAGTDALAQLPFFITACDYTLIGEELYAASAYLSREPLLLGSLKGQDIAKVTFITLVFLGTILAILGIHFLAQLFISPL